MSSNTQPLSDTQSVGGRVQVEIGSVDNELTSPSPCYGCGLSNLPLGALND